MKPRCPPMPTKAQISVTLIGVASIIVTGYVAMCKRKFYLHSYNDLFWQKGMNGLLLILYI